MTSKSNVDWSACSLVEVKPDVQSGSPVLRGRILFDENVPVGVRHFLLPHQVRTIAEMKSKVNSAKPGCCDFIEMQPPPRPGKRDKG